MLVYQKVMIPIDWFFWDMWLTLAHHFGLTLGSYNWWKDG